MQLTRVAATRLRDELAVNALGSDEVRRVAGMGEMYIAHVNTAVEESFTELQTLTINGATYKLYRKKAT